MFTIFKKNQILFLSLIILSVILVFAASMTYLFHSPVKEKETFQKGIKDTIEKDKLSITIYLKDDAKSTAVSELQKELSENQSIKTIQYISKDEAKKRYQEKFSQNNQLKDSLEEDNPLPASLEIETSSPNKIETLLPIIEKEQYKAIVAKVSY